VSSHGCVKSLTRTLIQVHSPNTSIKPNTQQNAGRANILIANLSSLFAGYYDHGKKTLEYYCEHADVCSKIQAGSFQNQACSCRCPRSAKTWP
jgi:hypothetical protein